MSRITRSPQETVLLEAMEGLAKRGSPCLIADCQHVVCVAGRALATVRSLDEAEGGRPGTGEAKP